MVLCGLRFDAAEKLLARSLRGRLRLVVFHLSLALAALTVGRQNHRATCESNSRRTGVGRARLAVVVLGPICRSPACLYIEVAPA
jgi:hypothetical protein